jgi:hypothetical protein
LGREDRVEGCGIVVRGYLYTSSTLGIVLETWGKEGKGVSRIKHKWAKRLPGYQATRLKVLKGLIHDSVPFHLPSGLLKSPFMFGRKAIMLL